MGGFAVWYGWTRDIRPKAHRKPSTFRELQLDLEGEMKKRQIKYRIDKCDPLRRASDGERLFSIQFPGKHPAWLYHQ